MKTRLSFVFLLLPALLWAQPSATMRKALLASVDVELSSASHESLERGGLAYGSVGVLSTSLSISGRHRLNEATSLTYGLAYQRHTLDATTPLLPDQLAELTLNFGLMKIFSPTWSGAVFIRPGLYSDFEDLGSSSFNLPMLALLNYRRSPDLTWNFGLSVNTFSNHPVLPIAGVRWQFAPGWIFNVGFPQSGFSWRFNDSVTWRAGVVFNGGNYRITRNYGVPVAGIARLANTYLDFHEVRVGLGADLGLGEGFTLALDLGAVTDRKFDYYDRGFRLDGDLGFFGTVAVRASF
ncbi:MAG: DUF6268 family outer membrane beta-barrel protein [Opitutae bacterium]